jgi:hypothetical protein
MELTKKSRRTRKKKTSYLNDWEDDFNDIENNFKESSEFDKKLSAVKPERVKAKKVKDQSLVESVATLEESVIESSKADSNIVDKGFYLDEKETEGFKETIELPLKEVIVLKEEAPLSQADIQAVQLEYEKKIKELKDENNKLRSVSNTDPFEELVSRKLKNNMHRFIQAVFLESKIQETEWPVISTNKLRKLYKVTSDSFKDCLTFGIDGGWIIRKEISYSGDVKTWAYKTLRAIPQ